MKRKSGFTLLELLVVISIIGILIAMSAVAFTTAQKRGRDAKRRGDIKSMQTAFEQYNADNSSSYATTCNAMMTSTYLPGGQPTDPQTGSNYYCSSTASSYCACALLEGTGTGNANGSGSGGTCTYGGSPANYYCLSNLQ